MISDNLRAIMAREKFNFLNSMFIFWISVRYKLNIPYLAELTDGGKSLQVFWKYTYNSFAIDLNEMKIKSQESVRTDS